MPPSPPLGKPLASAPFPPSSSLNNDNATRTADVSAVSSLSPVTAASSPSSSSSSSFASLFSYPRNTSTVSTTIPASAYLKQCEIGRWAKLPALRADVCPETLFSPWAVFGCCNLWIGDEEATKTGLHNDDEHNVLCQIRGQKRVVLICPSERPHLYPNELYDSGTECCDVDASLPDLRRHPLFARVRVRYEVTLEPGEVLYIPRFWYHEVNPVGDFSVSVNYFCSTPLDQLWWGIGRAVLQCLHGAGVYKRGKCVCHDCEYDHHHKKGRVADVKL